MAFGLDSAIELASAGVLIWRLNVELRHGQGFSERAERTASRIGAVLLFTLAAYIVAGAAWSLWTRHGEAFSLPGLIVALLAMPIILYWHVARSRLQRSSAAAPCGQMPPRVSPAAGCRSS